MELCPEQTAHCSSDQLCSNFISREKWRPLFQPSAKHPSLNHERHHTATVTPSHVPHRRRSAPASPAWLSLSAADMGPRESAMRDGHREGGQGVHSTIHNSICTPLWYRLSRASVSSLPTSHAIGIAVSGWDHFRVPRNSTLETLLPLLVLRWAPGSGGLCVLFRG